MILRHHFNVGILLCENISWDIVERAITSKYDFSADEIADIKSHTVFHLRPRLVMCKNILFTDGGVINASNVTLLTNNVLYFACGNKEICRNTSNKTWVLYDARVYDAVHINGINYKKRMLLDRLKQPTGQSDNLLVYATKNCRQFNNYEELRQYNKHIIAVVNEIPQDSPNWVEFVVPPVSDIFDKFGTYLYTPVPRKFDCSPRFIVECRHFGKEVIYHNIDYWDIDTGLFWRCWDIDNDWKSLFLTPDDEIVDIVKGII